MKIRVFALAKELDLDSKELIDYCNRAGIEIKNSALASISPDERDKVVEYIQQNASSPKTALAEKPLAPTREPAREVGGKVRAIRTTPKRAAAARAQGSRATLATAQASDVATMEPPGGETAVEEEERVADAELAAAELAEESAQTAPLVESKTASAPKTAGAQKPKGEGRIDAASKGPEEDESAPSGLGSGIREMRPRGTIPDSESRHARRPKAKTKPSLPNVAAPPTFKPPQPKKTPKPAEKPAQKPDIPLTADILEQQSPLRAHMQQKKKRKKLSEAEPLDLAEEPRRGGKGGAGVAEGRQQRRARRRGGREVTEEEPPPAEAKRRRMIRRRRQKSTAPVALKTSAQIELPVTVRGFSEAIGRPVRDILRLLFDKGEMTTINETVSEDTALEVAMELGVDLEVKRPRDIEDELLQVLEQEDPQETLVPRPPIITILGHVDHGKTTLLDKIRSGNVAGSEAGGITQHIAAYQVDYHGQKLTFVDTPGHAAFGEMRARGANVTDIVVLVVAADDGVMPQTVECISHARSAGVPILVAMNKIDLQDADQQKVLQDLAARELLPVEWGGDTEVVRTSGVTGEGLDTLLETLLVTAELHEFKANPNRPAVGVCLEAFRDEGRGPLAWLVVQTGTLRIGDVVLCGPAYGRVRALYNDSDEEIDEVGPSTPVKLAGLDTLPGPGDHLFVMSDMDAAREAAEARRERGRTLVLSRRGRPRTLEDILDAARGGAVQDLPLILKADTPGSIEALRSEIEKFEHPEVRVAIVHEGVGGVNESDVYLASASGAIIIAFQVVPEERARELAEKEGVQIRRYNVIYEVTESIKRALEGLLEPERREVTTGRALILQTFNISRYGTIAGCRVLTGTIERNNRIHVIRDQTILNDYPIASLRREKDDVREVREGMECGIRLDGFNDLKEGDVLEAYRVDKIKRTLD